MSSRTRNEDLPSSPPKKRKLKHPRTAKACGFCRRRKVRCSGTHPCDYCRNEGVRCEFEDGLIRPRNSAPADHPLTSSATQDHVLDQPTLQSIPRTELASTAPTSQSSRRNSVDLPQAFAEGELIGPTSGVSLLYHLHNTDKAPTERGAGFSVSLLTHGDIPQAISASVNSFQLPTSNEAKYLLDRYFRFATPTYRFLHRPTLEEWATQLTGGDGSSLSMTASRSACVLLACAQALLYSTPGDRYANGGDAELRRSQEFYAKAKGLLDSEPGPATISSVQARLAMCLYLLSTFRITECRFCFGFTNTVLTSLGLHRRASSSDRLGLIEVESTRRSFWCAYVLDGYLSVMLGRPRLFRDDDIDQPYPRNFDDQDLTSSESAEDLPLHGNLEAFVGHINLAKLMARNNDLLYPLQMLSNEQILSRTTDMIALINSWRDGLPDFLKPREKTLAGQRTFERQNTVLKLAYAHLSILATRRCLLLGSNCSGFPLLVDHRARNGIRECIMHISTIINANHDLLEREGLYQAFWFTHYISLVAISTLYVLVIQDFRAKQCDQSFQAAVPEVDLQHLLEKAKICQVRLATLSPEGSQSHRHHRLLDQLRARCEQDMRRARRSSPVMQPTGQIQSDTGNFHARSSVQHPRHGVTRSVEGDRRLTNEVHPPKPSDDGGVTGAFLQALDPGFSSLGNGPFLSMPHFVQSDEDETFQNFLECGWESLDTLGFAANAPFDDSIFMQ